MGNAVRLTDKTIRILAMIVAPLVFVGTSVILLDFVIGSSMDHFWRIFPYFVLLPAFAAVAFTCAFLARRVPLRWAVRPILLRLPVLAFLVEIAVWFVI